MKTNPDTIGMIESIEKNIEKTGSKFWKRILKELRKKDQAKREVNVFQINKHTKTGDRIIVPGKVLGDGELDHKITITYFNASGPAKNKLEKADIVPLKKLLETNPKGKGVKIIG